MANVTYLFGAGASCKALPMVNQMPERIRKMEELLSEKFPLKDDEFFPQIEHSLSQFHYQSQLIDDMHWLHNTVRGYASVDTFAKKLFITNSIPELVKLKKALTIYLLLEQLLNPADPRYDTFFASIIERHASQLPKNVRIVSWNYDQQFEKAFSQYSLYPAISTNQDLLNVVTKHDADPKTLGDRFTLFKINGSASAINDHPKRHLEVFREVQHELTLQSVQDLVGIYAIMEKWRNNWFALSFAWEGMESKFLEGVRTQVEKTDILVIIGYSMPYFNRDIDRLLLNDMKPQKVYIQSPQAGMVEARYRATMKDSITIQVIPYPDIEQFLLPNEL